MAIGKRKFNGIPLNEISFLKETSIPNLPPQNIEAEESTLGSLMMDGKAIIRVADFLKPKDFYKRTNAVIYESMLDLYERQEPIDLISLSNDLKGKNFLETVGGMAYLTSLVNRVPTPTNVYNYAKIVQRKRILRDLISVSFDISKMGYEGEGNEDIEVLLDKAEQKIFSVSSEFLSQDFTHVKSILEGAYDRIEKLHQGDGTLRGVPTGFTALDNILAGLQKSDVIILAARPSLGKTSLALDISRHVAAKTNIPVGIFSLEMSSEQIVDRLIAAEANIDLWKLRTGRLSYDGEFNDFERIADALDSLSKAPLYIEDAATISVLQMRAMARRLQAEKGLGLIVVDYIQLIDSQNPYDNMVSQVTQISRGLKAMAKELNVPVLALSQLSRAVEHRGGQRIPRLADLRESGSLEQDADMVLFIYREDRDIENTDRKNIADIIIAKHRNGPVGKVELRFNPDRASFENLAKEEGIEAGEEGSYE